MSVTDLCPNAQKLYFYDVDIHYSFIRQKLTISISDSIFKHKYENKYDISNICSYPIRLHPYSSRMEEGILKKMMEGQFLGASSLKMP